MSLPAPEDAGDKAYLGLATNARTFSLYDVQADVLVVEVFSPYCPHCQATAPKLNDVVRRVRAAGYPREVRFLGVAIDVSDFVIQRFRNTYDLSFPVLSDPDQEFAHALEARSIPYFFVIDTESRRVLGEFDRPDELDALLMTIREAAM
jgi:peroxiredoxin